MHATDETGTPACAGDLRDVIGGSRLFRGVGVEVIEFLLPSCRVIELATGQTLLAQTARNDSVFVVLAGRLRVQLLQSAELAIATIREGECVGEMSVIDGGAISADVIADCRSRILRIPQDVLWSMINASHGVARNLLFILSSRIRSDNDLIVDHLLALREFEQAAQVDALTGLHNRRWLNDAFARQIARCDEDGQPFCLVMIDIDQFKRINDSFGHVAGDRALVAAAAVLANNIRPMDLLARYGGEEFALGLPDTELDEAFAISERLRRAVELLALPFRTDDSMPHLTVSLGIARTQAGQTLDAMINAADAALYRAKDGGRNRVVI